MLYFSPDPYHMLVLQLFSTASCSVHLLLGEEWNKCTHILKPGCPPRWRFTRSTKVTLNLSKMKPDCSNALIKTALSRSVYIGMCHRLRLAPQDAARQQQSSSKTLWIAWPHLYQKIKSVPDWSRGRPSKVRPMPVLLHSRARSRLGGCTQGTRRERSLGRAAVGIVPGDCAGGQPWPRSDPGQRPC